MKKKIPAEVSAYMAIIGAKGGKASTRKLSPEQARQMASARWKSGVKFPPTKVSMKLADTDQSEALKGSNHTPDAFTENSSSSTKQLRAKSN